MLLLTMIGRVRDGLPLAASMREDEQHGMSLIDYQNQAKLLLRKIPQSSANGCIETGPCYFYYIVVHNVCYLVLCEKKYSKRLAHSFLEDIAQEFHSQYGKRVDAATRPYIFIEFDNYVQKAKKTYTDSRVRRNLNPLENELQDVQRIMVQNIDDVLKRGAVLSELDNKAQNLSMLSQKYKKDAAYLNTKSFLMKVAVVTVLIVGLVYYFTF